MPATRKWAEPVVVAPGFAVAGLRVADHVDGHCRGSRSRFARGLSVGGGLGIGTSETAHESAVGVVAEQCGGCGGRNPTALVDLVVGHERRFPGRTRRVVGANGHVPEPHLLLTTVPILVPHSRELGAEVAAVAGLFLDLAP